MLETWFIHVCDTTTWNVMAHLYVDVVTHSYETHFALLSLYFLYRNTLYRGFWWFMRVTWLFHGWDMTHSCLRHDAFVCHDSFVRMSWLIDEWVTTYKLYVMMSHNIQIRRMSWLICSYVMTHFFVWHDSFVGMAWLICSYVMTHLFVCHDSFVRMSWLMSWLIVMTYDSYVVTHSSETPFALLSIEESFLWRFIRILSIEKYCL